MGDRREPQPVPTNQVKPAPPPAPPCPCGGMCNKCSARRAAERALPPIPEGGNKPPVEAWVNARWEEVNIDPTRPINTWCLAVASGWLYLTEFVDHEGKRYVNQSFVPGVD